MSSGGESIQQLEEIIGHAVQECDRINKETYQKISMSKDKNEIGELYKSIYHLGSVNQDMSKFTSIKAWPDYSAFWLPTLRKLGACGKIIYHFMYCCFHKYYEMRTEAFESLIPDFKRKLNAFGHRYPDLFAKCFKLDVEALW